MDISVVLILLLSISLGVLGQFFFKSGMDAIKATQGAPVVGPGLVLCFFHPLVFSGLSCYAISSVFWLYVLSRVPLSIAYPCISMSYVFVVLLGKFHFHEHVTAGVWIGVLLICLGVFLIGVSRTPAVSH